MGKTRDQLNLISKLTATRLSNMAAVTGSFQLSKWSGRPRIKGLPMAFSVEPTTSCNLRCPECPSGLRSFTRPTGTLDASLFGDILAQLSETAVWLTFYFQGEPYLHPDFTRMVRMAENKGLYTSTSTNAHFLSEQRAEDTVLSGLDRLIISVDGTTQEAYEQYRVGGRLEKVIEGTERIVHYKRKWRSATPHVVFQFLVVRGNEHQVPEVQQLAQRLGVDEVSFKTAQIYDYEKGSPLIPQQDKFSRYRQHDDGSWSIKNKLENHCWKMWHSCVITWDGKVVPCCFDKDAEHVLGDLSEQSFSSIWTGDRYRDFRGALIRSRKDIEICRNCTEGTRIWA